jgi:hypothetical protein
VSDADLNQALTSAGAAMAFTCEHWEQFCAELPSITGGAVPITRADMHAHAIVLLELADPERMPL